MLKAHTKKTIRCVLRSHYLLTWHHQSAAENGGYPRHQQRDQVGNWQSKHTIFLSTRKAGSSKENGRSGTGISSPMASSTNKRKNHQLKFQTVGAERYVCCLFHHQNSFILPKKSDTYGQEESCVMFNPAK